MDKRHYTVTVNESTRIYSTTNIENDKDITKLAKLIGYKFDLMID
jgi:hypothetical protein